MPTPDLFPETLLVTDDGNGHLFTTSLKVAEHFGLRHDNVLKAIKKLLADCPDPAFRALNFEATIRSVPGPKGAVRTETVYHLSHDGFALLAMGLTGKKALQWKIDFLTAFRQMEEALKARESRFARALDRLRPALRPVVEGTEAGLARAAIAEPLGKSARAITYYRSQARRLGMLVSH